MTGSLAHKVAAVAKRSDSADSDHVAMMEELCAMFGQLYYESQCRFSWEVDAMKEQDKSLAHSLALKETTATEAASADENAGNGSFLLGFGVGAATMAAAWATYHVSCAKTKRSTLTDPLI